MHFLWSAISVQTRVLTFIMLVHGSHICDTAWIGHLHSNKHIPQCKTRM